MKRLTAILLLTVLMILTACENVSLTDRNNSIAESSNTNGNTNIYEEIESKLPTLNDGSDNSASSDVSSDVGQEYVPEKQSFVIATNDANAFYQSETAPGTISTALEERNTFLRDKYGADISVVVYDDDKIVSEMKKAIESGTKIADMLSFSAQETVNMYIAGLLYDMNTLPDFDITSDFFDKENGAALATNSTLYMIADPTTMPYENTFAMFFNRQLIIGSGAKNPEKLAMEGKWTWDAFYECCQTAAKGVFNTSIADFEEDTFGFAAYYTEGVYPMVMWASTGEKLIGNTYKNPISLTAGEKKMTEISAKLRSYYNSKGTLPTSGDDSAKAFQQGRLVFLCNTMNYLSALRNETELGEDYGFVPIPKYTEEQEKYYSLASTKARVIAVPKTVTGETESRLKFLSAVITAMCATGRSTVKDAYLNAHLALYLNSNEEAVMLKYICDGLTFDFSYIYGSEIREVYKVSSGAISEYIDFGSKVASSISNNIGSFNKYVEKNFQ